MTFIAVIGILLGAIAIGRSALEARRLRTFLSTGRYQTIWHLLEVLMVLFLLGYLAVGALIALGFEQGFLIYVVGFVFMGGALFVHAVTRVASQMVQSVIQTNSAPRPKHLESVPVPLRDRYSGTFRLNTAQGTQRERTAKLLVVDDNPVSREVLVRHLHRHGYATVTAADGRSALATLDGDRDIDLAIVDFWLPDMQGLDIVQHIKADERGQEMPVIMLSGEHDPDIVASCIEAGADDFLFRPATPRLLYARIEACLNNRWYRERLNRERMRSEKLLRTILPDSIAMELAETGRVSPRRHEDVAVLFADISGFTAYCDKRRPEEVMARLQRIVVGFEELTRRHGVQKIKTIGDAFMGASGLLSKSADPVLQCVKLGQELIEYVQRIEPEWQLRVGIHIGPVVAGIVGRSQFLFDIWGDTVNTASRIESCSPSGQVCVSAQAWRHIAPRVRGLSLGPMYAKGKGELELYQVIEVVSDGRAARRIAADTGLSRIPYHVARSGPQPTPSRC